VNRKRWSVVRLPGVIGTPGTTGDVETMSSPKLDIQVEPSESGQARYLPLAATTASRKTGVKIVLRLRLQNKSTVALKVTGITFSFPGSATPPVPMQGVNLDGSLDLDPDEAAFWSNGRVDLDPDPDVDSFVNNSVYLVGPAPAQVKVDVKCKDFSDPATVTLALAAHKSGVPAGAYRFPYAAGELRKDEFYATSAVHWANGGSGGTQIFAHDIGVVGWDNGSWSSLVPGGDSKKNEDYRIWGKPVRAMADGIVEDFHDGMDDNTVLGKFPQPTPSPVGGNNITIRHGTELVKYSHFRKGSMPAAIKQKGVAVSAGQLLGRAGNTGNSTNPHTHIHCVRASDSALRPLPLRSAWVIDRTTLSPPGADGPWFRLQGHGIPKDAVSIWPASPRPATRSPTVGIAMAGDWANSFFIRPDLASFQKTAQELFDDKGRRLIRVTTFTENGARRWMGISRAGDWANRWWVSPDLASFQKTAQELFDEKGLRLVHVSTFVEGGKRSWIGIARAGDWASRLTIKDSLSSFSKATQELFDDKGLRLIHALTWMDGGQRWWFGISRSGNWANRWWISTDLGSFSTKAQDLFDNEGKRLVHVTSYVEGGERRWLGISRSGDWANRWFVRSDLDSFSLEAQRLFDDEGLRLIQVETLG